MPKSVSFLLLLALSAATAWGQSPRSAIGGEGGLWVGGEMSSFNPDYSCSSNIPFHCSSQLLGPAVFFNLNLRPRWGAEGEARWMNWHGPGGQSESNYLLGPRYRVFQYHRLSGWTKILFGGGWTTTPYYPQAGSLRGSYFVYAPGGTLSYHLTQHLAIRGDYEYQFWPSFAGPSTFNGSTVVDHNHGLTPNGFSLGVAWRFLGQ
ncbi:MAG TPA: outer membrane beta-barrel protein [Acidobacteriaceae bacterium]|jgi:hypothetical protein|nr:outer membrane beta-barrel protein [Acidobacteriaceae bacterium]